MTLDLLAGAARIYEPTKAFYYRGDGPFLISDQRFLLMASLIDFGVIPVACVLRRQFGLRKRFSEEVIER